jgi:hypothetical protein
MVQFLVVFVDRYKYLVGSAPSSHSHASRATRARTRLGSSVRHGAQSITLHAPMGHSRGHKGTGANFRDGVSKLERRLLAKGTLSAKERKIILLREEKKAAAAKGSTAAGGTSSDLPSSAASSSSAPAASKKQEALIAQLKAEGTRKARLAEAAIRGLCSAGIDEKQSLRRLARIHQAEEAAAAAEAEKPTPAAATALAALRADMLGGS